MDQKAAADMAVNFINMERLVISPQNGLGSSHDSSSVPTFDSRGSNSPPTGLNGDIFSTADMFQGGESNRSSKKGVDESVPPKSKVPRLKIDSIHKFGDYGSAPGLFSEPSGVAVNPLNGNILIADTNNHRVEVYIGISGNFNPVYVILLLPYVILLLPDIILCNGKFSIFKYKQMTCL